MRRLNQINPKFCHICKKKFYDFDERDDDSEDDSDDEKFDVRKFHGDIVKLMMLMMITMTMMMVAMVYLTAENFMVLPQDLMMLMVVMTIMI